MTSRKGLLLSCLRQLMHYPQVRTRKISMNRQVRHAFLSRGGTVEELRVRKINTQVRNALL